MKNQLFHHYSTFCIIVILSILLNFIACSESDNPTEPQKATVSGTLNLPEDAAGKTWVVIFDTDIDGGNGYPFMGMGTCPNGTEVPYTVNDVNTGKYYLYSIVFIGGDFTDGPQSGDFIGIYGGEYPDNAPASPNAQITTGTNTFDIDLVVMMD